jgi:hypothetical protein
MPKKATKKTRKKVTKKVQNKRAGRPKGSGKFGCATKAVRVPVFLEEDVQAFVQKKLKASKKKAGV